MSRVRTNRKTKGKFLVPKEDSFESKVLKEFGIKKLTPRVDGAVALVREQEKNPKSDYLVRWRAYTKDFTKAEWDELARRLSIVL